MGSEMCIRDRFILRCKEIFSSFSNIANNNVVFQLISVNGNINNRCRLQFMHNSSPNSICTDNLLSNLAIMLKRIRRNTNSARIKRFP